MNRFLLILGIAILYGCASREINISNEKLLPKDESFTLVGDSNSTGIPSFQELFPIEDLNYLVKEGLQNNPSWNSQLARLEMEKIKSGISVTDSKPKLSARIGWQEGEEKTRESNFEKSKLILASTTPSLETVNNINNKKIYPICFIIIFFSNLMSYLLLLFQDLAHRFCIQFHLAQNL